MLPGVEIPFLRLLGRCLQWPSFDLCLVKHPNESRDQQTCGNLSKCGHVGVLNRAQLAPFEYPKISSTFTPPSQL